MRKLGLVSGVLCLTAMAAMAQPYQTWNRYREITVNTTSANGGANVAGNVANFPLLINLSSTGGAATGANVLTEALAGGADLRFTDSTGNTPLSYQIESWSTNSGAVWVKVPVVTGNATTKIRMYWGRSGQTSLSNGPAVFDTANGYTGVWHLSENGAGTVADATANGLNFTGHASVPAVPGIAGNARYYNQGQGGADEYFVDERANDPKFYANGASTAITISAWVNRRNPGSSGSQGVFSNFRYAAGGNRSYALMRNADGNFNVLTSVNGTGDTRRVSTSETFADNAWHHVVATINPAAATTPVIRIWVNGVAQTTTGTNTTGANAAVFQATAPEAMPLIGALERSFQQGTESFIDVLKFSNGTIRDSNWIVLSYQTQRPAGTAVTMGATQSVSARALYYPTKHAVYTRNTAISNNTPVTSGAASGWTITPSTLPAGLSFSSSTGVISGTPTTAVAQTQFIVNATVGGSPAADTISITVSAGDPPGTPGAPTVTGGNAQAVVSWTAPLSSGSSAITGYTARATQDTTKTCTWTSGPLTCTITGLTNGTAYTFVVRATSGAGNSPFSAVSNSVTPASVPGAPTGVTATQVTGARTINVSWTAPTATGGAPILAYYARFVTPDSSACFAQPPATTCQVTNLTLGNSYSFAVRAVNAVGEGPLSTPSGAVTVGILPGSFAIQVNGSVKPFAFTLTPEALASTSALTMTITDLQGRAVWSKTVNPAKDGTREIRWNGTNTTGRAVSAGVYMVRVSTVNGGVTTDLIKPAANLK